MVNIPLFNIENDLIFFKKILNLSNSNEITEINNTPLSSATSNIFFVEVKIKNGDRRYERKFFVKRSSSESGNYYHNLCVNEINFYKYIVQYKKIQSMFPKCYYADIDTVTKNTLLILEDLSNTYYNFDEKSSDYNLPIKSCSCLAKFHAYFWNHKNLKNIISSFSFKKQIIEYDALLKKFIINNCDLLSKETLTVIYKSYEIFTYLLKEKYSRQQKINNITIINGDAHIYNFLFPLNKNHNPKIIDFQFWETGIGCLDLAHLTRKLSPNQITLKFHQDLLKKYYESLISYGVTTYSYEQCYNDYRICIASLVLNPIWQYSKFNIPFEICIKPMNTLISNFKMFNCETILDFTGENDTIQ